MLFPPITSVVNSPYVHWSVVISLWKCFKHILKYVLHACVHESFISSPLQQVRSINNPLSFVNCISSSLNTPVEDTCKTEDDSVKISATNDKTFIINHYQNV